MHLNKNNLRFGLLFLGPYPKGNVSTIRIHSYCKALADKGHFVKVYLIAPCTEAAVNTQSKGIFEGVHYEYITKITWEKQKTKNIIKFYYYIIGLVKSLKCIKKDEINCLLSYHSYFLTNAYFWAITRIFDIPFIIDKTEYPYGYHNMSRFRKKIVQNSLKFYDGFIVISNELKEFYSKIKNNVFLLPMTVDKNRFKGIEKQAAADSKYIAVVFGTHNRDGLKDSVIAYNKYLSLLNDKKDAYRLKLLGDFLKLPDRDEIMQYIEKNKINGFIDIMGLVDIDRIPHILKNASCLLTTPSRYVSGGFPTKLGEYMLSKTPIVATEVGEITCFLKDKEDILLSKPGNMNKIAEYILFVQNNPDIVTEMANNAYNKVLDVFNAKTYIDDLIKFIFNNENNKKQ